MIKLSPQAMSINYIHFQQSVPATSAVEQLIPSGYSLWKSVFVTMRKQTSVLNADPYPYSPNTRSFAILDYCFRLGPEQIPPSTNTV